MGTHARTHAAGHSSWNGVANPAAEKQRMAASRGAGGGKPKRGREGD